MFKTKEQHFFELLYFSSFKLILSLKKIVHEPCSELCCIELYNQNFLLNVECVNVNFYDHILYQISNE